MTTLDWYDEDGSLSDQISAFEQRKKSKERKRRWREIETIKETRRLKRELAELNVHSWF